jgi:hypothetical protein
MVAWATPVWLFLVRQERHCSYRNGWLKQNSRPWGYCCNTVQQQSCRFRLILKFVHSGFSWSSSNFTSWEWTEFFLPRIGLKGNQGASDSASVCNCRIFSSGKLGHPCHEGSEIRMPLVSSRAWILWSPTVLLLIKHKPNLLGRRGLSVIVGSNWALCRAANTNRRGDLRLYFHLSVYMSVQRAKRQSGIYTPTKKVGTKCIWCTGASKISNIY